MKKLLSLVMVLVMALCLSGCTKSIQEAKVGDVVEFGQYAGEKLRWIVLDTEISGEKLLIAEKGVKVISFHDWHTPMHWSACSLRQWLNNEFFDTFTKEEKSKIKTKLARGGLKDKNGNLMYDNFFCLSMEQIEKYRKKGINFSKCEYIDSDYVKKEAEFMKKLWEVLGYDKKAAQEEYDRRMKMDFAWWLSDACTGNDAKYLEPYTPTGILVKDLFNKFKFDERKYIYGTVSGWVYFAYAVDYKGEIRKIPQSLFRGYSGNTYVMVRPAVLVKCE